MRTCIDPVLGPLVKKLRARYPNVNVVDARLTTWRDGLVQQAIRYQAPLATLKRCGLVTEEMLRRRVPGSACGETSLGEAFHLSQCFDTQSAAVWWNLDVCTDSAPREPDEPDLGEAQRTLAGLFRAPGVQRLE
jgi:hypothetical protein